VILEVIDSLADEDRVKTTATSETDASALHSWAKETSIVTWASTCCEYTVGTTIYLLHLLRFLLKVPITPLDNTDRVNPKVRATNGSSHSDSIPEGAWKMGYFDTSNMLLYVGSESAKLLTRAPLMRQRYPVALVTWGGLKEMDFSVVGTIHGNDSCW
jgi:hypothetical protein